jgi:hypothetical protein
VEDNIHVSPTRVRSRGQKSKAVACPGFNEAIAPHPPRAKTGVPLYHIGYTSLHDDIASAAFHEPSDRICNLVTVYENPTYLPPTSIVEDISTHDSK